MVFEIKFKNNQFFTDDKKDIDKLFNSCFGEKLNNKYNDKLFLNNFEVVYLLENKKIFLSKNFNNLIKKEDKLRYLVYKYLRDKNLCVKTGLKYGVDFRVYDKKKFWFKEHSKYLVKVIKENEKKSINELVSINRISNNTHKKLILAIVDNSFDITFLEVSWKKF